MLAEKVVREAKIVQDLDSFLSLASAHLLVKHGQYHGHELDLDSPLVCLGLLAHGKLELSDLPHRFSLAGVFAEPLGEARVEASASEQEAGCDRAARAELGQQAPVHVCADLSVKRVTERDKLGGLGHGLNIVQ